MLTPRQIAALIDVENTWPNSDVVIIGATAIGFYLEMAWRQTDDVDLALAIEMDELIGGVGKLPTGWKPDTSKPHRFYSPLGQQLDLLPAGPKAVERGVITWPNEHLMAIDGVDLAFAHAAQHRCLQGYVANVAPPPVITFLKMSALLDNREREKDALDIGHLLGGYIDMDKDPDRFWDEAREWEHDVSFLPAHVLGKDLRAIAGESHLQLASRFFDKVYGDLDDDLSSDAYDDAVQAHRRLQFFKAALGLA